LCNRDFRKRSELTISDINISVTDGAVVDVNEFISKELSVKKIGSGDNGWERNCVRFNRWPINRHVNESFENLYSVSELEGYSSKGGIRVGGDVLECTVGRSYGEVMK
jgi:hypothetical protein